MFRYSLILCFLFVETIVFGQTEKAITIHLPQSFFLTSQAKYLVGGKPFVVLDVNLPPNTVKWYYTFSTARDESKINTTKSNLNLLTQLSSIIDYTGTTANAINALTAPPGEDYCNTYLLQSYSDAVSFAKNGGGNYIRLGSRANFKSGTVEITNPTNCKGVQYIGINNPSGFYGINCAIEVVAIVNNQFTNDQRKQIYNVVYNSFIKQGFTDYISDYEIKKLSACIVDKLSLSYGNDVVFSDTNYGDIKNAEQYILGCMSENGINAEEIYTSINSKSAVNVIEKGYFVGTWLIGKNKTTFQDDGLVCIESNNKKVWAMWRLENNIINIIIDGVDNYIDVSIIDNRRFGYSPRSAGVTYFAEKL